METRNAFDHVLYLDEEALCPGRIRIAELVLMNVSTSKVVVGPRIQMK